VLIVNLLAALNYANVFFKIKNVWKTRNVTKRLKNVEKRDQNKRKRKKTFFLHLCRNVRSSAFLQSEWILALGD